LRENSKNWNGHQGLSEWHKKKEISEVKIRTEVLMVTEYRRKEFEKKNSRISQRESNQKE
jgi:hypothetical protein